MGNEVRFCLAFGVCCLLFVWSTVNGPLSTARETKPNQPSSKGDGHPLHRTTVDCRLWTVDFSFMLQHFHRLDPGVADAMESHGKKYDEYRHRARYNKIAGMKVDVIGKVGKPMM
jgi:hypothetical protein